MDTAHYSIILYEPLHYCRCYQIRMLLSPQLGLVASTTATDP